MRLLLDDPVFREVLDPFATTPTKGPRLDETKK